jgi:4-alpha-glucanotransferase
MKIVFFIRFSTIPGQSLEVTGNIEALGSNDASKALKLSYYNSDFWSGEIDLMPSEISILQYRYQLQTIGATTVPEGGNGRKVDLEAARSQVIHLVDTWNFSGEYENVFFTDPFQQILLESPGKQTKTKAPKKVTHQFRVQAPLLSKNQVVCLSGNGLLLGDWNTESPILMNNEDGWWTVSLSIPHENFPLQYKYGIYDSKKKEFVQFESGPNRSLQGDAIEKLSIIHDGFVHLPNDTWKGAGVAIPVFSLRTKNSFGVGEFNDIKTLADWAKKIGLKLIQVLPVNDTTATHTWTDSYPYSAISAFALHPIYLNLETIAGKKMASIIKPLKKKQKQLNDQTVVNYEEVLKLKLMAAKELFMLEKDEFLKDEEYQKFFTENRHWLVPYAAFCYLRDRNGSADFTTWKVYSNYDKAAIVKYVSPKSKHYAEIAFQYYLQYHLHLQLSDAVAYVHKQGMIMKGDIPIGVYRYSCDAWMEPELYHMDQQAGAPPDGFAVKGQNWGFPTYNWERMSEDGFKWWHKRFHQMSYYFDAFRIDHILGFFRIWSIPLDSVEGIMGRFVPAIAVGRDEFINRGLWFDVRRFCQPFINDYVLSEMFGENAQQVLEYLQPTSDGYYELKEEYNTQRKVENHFAGLEQNDHNSYIKQSLFDLLSNLILFEDKNEGHFHFRFGMENTISFRHLDSNTQYHLRELYVDYFFRRQDDFWRREAMKKLPALRSSTNMLICGEDLGLVPHCVPDVMKQLGILSLEIQRMPKQTGTEFFHPATAPYLSVVTPSTHDMSTIRGWWEENPESTQRFYNRELGQWGEAPRFCEDWINKSIVLQHLYSPAMWSIFQLQDLMGMDEKIRRIDPNEERINIPANPKHYWQYRMHMSIEDLSKQKEFNDNLKQYIEASGR